MGVNKLRWMQYLQREGQESQKEQKLHPDGFFDLDWSRDSSGMKAAEDKKVNEQLELTLE